MNTVQLKLHQIQIQNMLSIQIKQTNALFILTSRK